MHLLNVPIAYALLLTPVAFAVPFDSQHHHLAHGDRNCSIVVIYETVTRTKSHTSSVWLQSTSVTIASASSSVGATDATSASASLAASSSAPATESSWSSSAGSVAPPTSSAASTSSAAASHSASGSTLTSMSSPVAPPSSLTIISTSSSPPSTSGGVSPGGAKGVGAWAATNDVQDMIDLGVTWTYDWGAKPAFESDLPDSIEFVPMIWEPQDDTQSNWDSIKAAGSKYKYILNFNEPDVNNIAVQDAIAIYPKLQATGLKIGSPAPANAKLDGSDWFDTFMGELASQKLPLDFIALHHYADDFNIDSAVATFKAYIEAVHAKYPYPIWITEYAMVSYSNYPSWTLPDDATQAAYATAATKMLQSLDYVERFAWFALPAASNQPACNLYNGGTITEVGKAYKAI